MRWFENLKDVLRELWKRHRLITIILIAAIIVEVSAVIWVVILAQPDTPLTLTEKAFIKEVLPRVISEEAEPPGLFYEKISKELDTIEKVYYQSHKEEHVDKCLFYVKYKGEKGYHLYFDDKYCPIFPLAQIEGMTVSIHWVSASSYLKAVAPEIILPIPTELELPGIVNRPWFHVMIVLTLVGGLGFFLFWFHRRQFGDFIKKCYERYAGEEISFDKVAGLKEEKERVHEVVDFINKPEQLKALGAKIPKGLLLVGPPGCGKTLLARAVATAAKVPFFSISGSEFVEMFVGVGASRIRYLFDRAKRRTPCIVFIDEVDAIARKREAAAVLTGAHQERESTLNQLLVEMDGLESGQGIVVIAATNREDLLDEAFTRPGRIDRRIYIGHPDLKCREEIFRVHSQGKLIAKEVNFRKLAQGLPLGTSGADIAKIVNEAAIHAGRNNKKEIDSEDFQYAHDEVILGPEKKTRELIEKEKKISAYHEAGHALVAKLLPDFPLLNRVSIIPRGESLGQTQVLPQEDRYIQTKEEILDNIAYCLGSIAAEQEGFGTEGTTGAAKDIEKATELAMGMITVFGMSKTIGLVSLKKLIEQGQAMQTVNDKVVQEIKIINDGQLERARSLILEDKTKLEALVKVLTIVEDIDQKMANLIFDDMELREKILKADEVELEDIINNWIGGGLA